MKKWIRELPIPISGVMLSIAALGNLYQQNSQEIHLLCGILTGILFIVLTMKFICYPKQLKEALQQPEPASVLVTYTMTWMLLSVYLKPVLHNVSFYIWILGGVAHLFLVVRFTIHYVFKVHWRTVFATYYIGYAGIATIGITAPAYQMEKVGAASVWVALVCVGFMLFFVTYRYLRYPDMKESDKLLFCVYASPISVCLTGYLNSVRPIEYPLLLFLFLAAQFLCGMSFLQAFSHLRGTFYVSFSAFTFPFVISAMGAQKMMQYLDSLGQHSLLLKMLVDTEKVVALFLVVYTLIRFINYMRTETRY
ncbi:MAG: TDT family transporter [Lachnospiraceae bacterium]